MAAPNEITVSQLLRLIGTPDAPAIVDVCIDADFGDDPYLIPGSIRHPHTDISGLISAHSGRACVIVCQKGRKLSQGVAAWLRSDGIDARYLHGGMLAWRDRAEAPRVPATTVPPRVGSGSLWVTRHRPRIDRIACPWLIRRFVDPQARVLFVAPADVEDVAERFGAVPFDVQGVFWSHRGDGCTFDTMLDEFALHTPPLDRMARIIRAADTSRQDRAPEAAGLFALSIGLSRQYRDDQHQLEAGLAIYDALFRWARDRQGETHGWPAGHGA